MAAISDNEGHHYVDGNNRGSYDILRLSVDGTGQIEWVAEFACEDDARECADYFNRPKEDEECLSQN